MVSQFCMYATLLIILYHSKITHSFLVSNNHDNRKSRLLHRVQHSLGRLAIRQVHGASYLFMGNDDGSNGEDMNFLNLPNGLESINGGMRKTESGEPRPKRPPNKADVYSNEELMKLFQIHQSLTAEQENENQDKKDEAEEINSGMNQGEFSLHDLVLQAVKEVDEVAIDDGEDDSKPLGDNENEPKQTEIGDNIPKSVSNIRAIATDVDGTLLTSEQTLHPRTEEAIRQAVEKISDSAAQEKNYFFFPATGKSREGALSSFEPEIRSLLSKLPGVFVQGLHCVDSEGRVVFEKKLSKEAIIAAEQLAAEYGVTVIGYDGDSLYVNKNGKEEQIKEIARYKEPMPETIDIISEHDNGVNKLLLMDFDTEKLRDVVRPQLEALAVRNSATVTQAMPGMLELLPEDCSKALGVQKLCDTLGIDASTELLAIGDAENDVGMLKMAAIGVAVGNACPMAKDAADYVMEETNNDGGAGTAIENYGFGSDPTSA